MKSSGYVTAIILTTILCACGGRHDNTQSLETNDSLTMEEVDIAEHVEIPLLPDTCYASVDGLAYTIDIADTEIDPTLSSTIDLYEDTPGAFTFRKGSRRLADFGGRVEGTPTDIVVDWKFETTLSPKWGGGSGWTGQPVYVEWPDSCIDRFKSSGVVEKDFCSREIIVGSLSGAVYFINFDTGKPSREPINLENPIKGTISLDPTLNGNLYVGQGIPDIRPFGAFVIDLYRHKVGHFFAEDPDAGRKWGAYDSSPVRVGQFLIRPGENGTLYKFLIIPGSLKLQSSLRYKINGKAPGMEASIGVYSNYGYIADNAGNVICVNLNTMRPVWRYSVGDDVDHSLIVEVENGHPYVYTGCEIDKQVEGTANFVKLDGLTGQLLWKLEVPGRLAEIVGKHFDGGFYATSLPGIGDCSNLLFANCVLNTNDQNGVFMAIDKTSGKVVYKKPLATYAWSSPVGFVNERGEQFVFAADCAGNVYLIRGRDGEILVKKKIGNNFESSPVVSGNSLVVGSRGSTIFKLSIK